MMTGSRRLTGSEIAIGTVIVAVLALVVYLVLEAVSLPGWLAALLGGAIAFLVWVGLYHWLWADATVNPVSAPASPPAPAPVASPEIAPPESAAPAAATPAETAVVPVAAVRPADAAPAIAEAAPVRKAQAKRVAGPKPKKLFEAPEGAPDDLKLIVGIGPVLEKKLNAIGITTWKQVAALTETQIAAVEEQVGFAGRVKRDNWLQQAEVLARGGVAEYERVFGKKPH